ncbi:MAG: vanadium-dependent haloperoxidase [bacterium]
MFSERNYARQIKAKEIREKAADIAFNRSHPQRINNGEEEAYGYLVNFHKGLPHDDNGEVQHSAYQTLLTALTTGDPNDFENIPLMGTGNNYRKLVNPQCGLAFDLEGPDAQSLMIPPAPRVDGAENSSEMGELYWMALLRDVHFAEYRNNHNLVNEAVDSMNNDFSDFRGPRNETNEVDQQNLFRGIAENLSDTSLERGELKGSYVSQFLLKGNADSNFGFSEEDGYIRFGTLRIDQRNRVAIPYKDFMTEWDEWLAVQNGEARNPNDSSLFESKPKFIRNLRDLATYVHFDQLYQAYFNACIYLLEAKYPLGEGNPYYGKTPVSTNQDGFGAFGGPHILSLVTEVATRALKAVWHTKWYVHRRFRPEAFGGLIHAHLTGKKQYSMINNEILDCLQNGGLSQHFSPASGDSYLLPMAFPEGSPMHPAYGAGHATVAGACVTILKAWFKDTANFKIPDPSRPDVAFKLFEANAEGDGLVEYTLPDGDELTVGSELNKLASNISIGRNAAGVHWRTDYTASIKLGESIAIGILQEQSLTYNELRVDGEAPYFEFTCFDGRQCYIQSGEVRFTANSGAIVARAAFIAPPAQPERGEPDEPTATLG